MTEEHGIMVLVYPLKSCSHSFFDGFHNKVVGSKVSRMPDEKPVFRMITETERYRDLFQINFMIRILGKP